MHFSESILRSVFRSSFLHFSPFLFISVHESESLLKRNCFLYPFFPGGLYGEVGFQRVVFFSGVGFPSFLFFSSRKKALPYDIINVFSCAEISYMLGP